MFVIEKPLPAITEDNAPYWEGCRRGELRAQRCTACERYRWPPAVLCPHCLAPGGEWVRLSGRGTIHSFIVVHRPQHPAFLDDVPYNVAIVELEEGIRTHTNVVGCPNEALRVGLAVEVEFQRVNDEVTLAKFHPRG